MKMTDNLKRAHFLNLAKYGNRINEDQGLVVSILKSHLEYVQSKKLYKFRTCNEDNFSALEKGLIYMSPACKFQDTFDSVIRFNPERCKIDLQKWLRANLKRLAFITFNGIYLHNPDITYEHFMDFISEQSDSEPPVPPQDTDTVQYISTIDTYNKMLSALENNIDNIASRLLSSFQNLSSFTRTNSLIYCMTEQYKNNSLWENYADNYKGFCIEYSFDKCFEKPFDDYKNLLYLVPVTYKNRIPLFDIISFLNSCVQRNLIHGLDFNNNLELQANLNMQLYYKKGEYAYEKEWRFAIKNNNNNMQPFPFVSAIYVGKTITPPNLERLKTIAEKLNVPIYQQNLPNGHFEYQYDSINSNH